MFNKRGENFKAMEKREVKTSWKDLIRAFISSDDELEKQDSEEESKNKKKYSKELSQLQSNIGSLEEMLDHPDVKVRGKERRKSRSQSRIETKENVTYNREESEDRDEQDIER